MSGLTGKNSLSIRKKDVKESRSKATGFQKLVFAHKASAGDTGINLSALTVPPEMSALGFTNPTSARLLEAKAFQFQDNLTLTSSAKNSLVKNLSYTVPSNSQINFEGFTAEEGEIFIGVLDSNPVNAVTAADARALAVTGILTAGQTDINVGQPFELNKFPAEQAGAVMVFVDGVLQTRNSGNSSTNQDGNYYEVGSQDIASVIRMNNTDTQDRSWVVVSNGALVEPPRDSSFAAIEKVSGQVDSLIPTVAALAGVPETDFQVAPNNADLKVFGDRVLLLENVLDAEVPIVTEWVPYDLEITADTSNPSKATTPIVDEARWRRVGDTMEIQYRYTHTNNAGASSGTGSYSYSLPNGLQVDLSKVGIDSAGSGVANVGGTQVFSTIEGSLTGEVFVRSETELGLFVGSSTEALSSVGSSYAFISETSVQYNFYAKVPIQGWDTTQTLRQQLGL